MESEEPGPVDASQWIAFAREAFAIAGHMTEPEAKRLMLVIARGYELLAEHAGAREAAKIAAEKRKIRSACNAASDRSVASRTNH